MLEALGRMASEINGAQRRQIREHAQALLQASLDALPDPADQARVTAAFKTAEQKLQA